MRARNVVIRILGNDLNGLHGDYQTYNNLEFTLENEPNFKDTDKVFILNRIVDETTKNKIEELLKKYNLEYIDIPFEKEVFSKLDFEEFDIEREIDFDGEILISEGLIRLCEKLKAHNFYLININATRNFALDFGKKEGYEWTFVLDSNNFFTESFFEDIINNIKEDTELVLIPQIRVNNNKDVFDENILNDLSLKEPQMAFNKNSELTFNDEIPYGTCDKAEMLNAIGLQGVWNNWTSLTKIYNIENRSLKNVNYQILSKIIRLSSFNNLNDNARYNFIARIIGLYRLILRIRDDNRK